MATTTGGTTYVTSTDLVANYPTASLALANRVDVVASGGPNSIKTSGYTITLADILGGNKFLYNSASPGTFTLPTSGLVDGMTVNVAQIGAGALTVSGGTIVGTTATTAQYQSLQFVYASTGTTWYSVAPPAVAPGLAIVTPTSIANSGGSATASGGQVTFTGVTSVSLNGIFTSTYDNYRLLITGNASLDTQINARVRVAGTDASGANYQRSRNYDGTQSNAANETSFYFQEWNTNLGSTSTMEIGKPALTQFTTLMTQGFKANSATVPIIWEVRSFHAVSTAYDGITLYPASGNITGTIRVYGYKNS